LIIEAGLVVARFLHYAAVTVLAGTSFFPLYAYPLGGSSQPIALNRRLRTVLFIAAIAAFLSGILWFVFTVADMSGAMDGILRWEILSTVLGDTRFGRVWMARFVLAIAVIAVIWSRFDSGSNPRRDVIAPVLTAALLISLAGVGHSQVEEGIVGTVHVVSDGVHLLAAGAWLGGLLPLGFMLLNAGNSVTGPPRDLNGILLRFSGMGYVAVATLIGSGLVNSWFLVGTVSGLLETAYGRVLVTKLVLFAGMLALAVSNRFWIVPSLATVRPTDPSGPAVWAKRLRNHVLSEQLLGLMVLLIVSVLGMMRPAIGQ
jgi:copper resistance protein D